MNLLEQHILSKYPFTPAEATFVSSFFKEETLNAGEFFVRQDNACAKLGVVTEGILKTYYTDTDGEAIRYFSVEQQWTGHLECFNYQKQSPESICAISDCRLFTITYHSFQTLWEASAHWPQAWELFKMDISSARLNPYRNIPNPKDRYEAFIYTQPDLGFRLSTQDIGAYLQIPHEKLLQILCEMLFTL